MESCSEISPDAHGIICSRSRRCKDQYPLSTKTIKSAPVLSLLPLPLSPFCLSPVCLSSMSASAMGTQCTDSEQRRAGLQPLVELTGYMLSCSRLAFREGGRGGGGAIKMMKRKRSMERRPEFEFMGRQ